MFDRIRRMLRRPKPPTESRGPGAPARKGLKGKPLKGQPKPGKFGLPPVRLGPDRSAPTSRPTLPGGIKLPGVGKPPASGGAPSEPPDEYRPPAPGGYKPPSPGGPSGFRPPASGGFKPPAPGGYRPSLPGGYPPSTPGGYRPPMPGAPGYPPGAGPSPVPPQPPAPQGMSLDRKLDIIGIVLVFVGLISLFSLFTSNQSPVLAAWLNLLRGLSGWGVFGLPLGFMGVGLWLVLRKFGDKLPRFEPERLAGIILLYLGLLASLHFATPLVTPPDYPEFFDFARAGGGGGLVGAVILWGLFHTLGAPGSAVLLVAWWLIGIIFTAGLSVPELVELIGKWAARLRRAGRPATAASPMSGGLRLFGRPRQLPLPDPKSGTPSLPAPAAAPSAAPSAALGAGPGAAMTVRPPIGAPNYEQPIVIGEPHVWVLPAVDDLLEPGSESTADDEFDRKRVQTIESTLASFGAPVKVVEINRGPAITQFGVEPDFVEQRGGKKTKVKVSKIAALADDLALALSAQSIRIEAPVPGKGYVGIEVPNVETSLVALRDVMEAEAFAKLKGTLRLGLGQDVSGSAIAADLTQMPHLLIAGTTGSGKSVCVNSVIACLLLQNTPDDLKLLMVDPKRVELTGYNGVPHLLAPVVVDLERVVASLQWVSREMDERYRRFAKAGVRNIADYNTRADSHQERRLPYLIVIIDELADLMMLAPDETERTLTRLAQLARATGIHLVIATQRPSVDVVTGLIKANFPARIAFAVASSVDSRVIIDQPGAERLLGRGDMLFQSPDSATPLRMQGVFVSDYELQRVVRYWREQRFSAAPPASETAEAEASPAGGPAHLPAPSAGLGAGSSSSARLSPAEPIRQQPLWEELQAAETRPDGEDEMLEEAIQAVRDMKKASISMLQRRLRIGYTRAARLIDVLEEKGIIGPAESGAKPREVLDYGGKTVDPSQPEPPEASA